MNIAVLGAGAGGRALATVVQRGGHSVRSWGRDRAHLEDGRQSGVVARAKS